MDRAHKEIARILHRHRRCLTGVGFIPSVRAQTPTNGLIMLIQFEKIDGIRHWERELDQRGC